MDDFRARNAAMAAHYADDPDDTPPPFEPLGLRWVDDVLADPPEEPPELVKGFLRRGELTAVVAPRAVGKSFLVFNLAACLAGCQPLFLGELPVMNQARTLIAQGELDEWGSWSRWRMLCGSDSAPEGVAETFDRWRIRIITKRSGGRDETSGRNWTEETHEAVIDGRLEQTIVDNGFDVLVIDPWAVYFAGRENNNDEAEAALGQLRDLSMRTGVALVIVHHISKATEAREPEDLWRGASRLADWASTRVTMLPHYKREADWEKAGLTRQQARRRLDVHFLRRGTPTEDFSIEWDPRSAWWQRWVPPDEEKKPGRRGGKTQAYTAEELVAALERAGGEATSKTNLAQVICGLSSTNPVEQPLKEAINRGWIVPFKTGRKNATGYRVPGDRPALTLGPDGDPGPTFTGSDHDEEYF